MHCDLTGRCRVIAGIGHKDADLAHAIGGCIVNIRHDILAFDRGNPADRHVLADLRDLVGQRVLYALATHIRGQKRLDAVHTGGQIREPGDHLLELRILGDEIGFRVHLDGDTASAIHLDGHETLGGRPARFLGGLGKALGPQPVNRGLHVAIGLGQRLLGIHHACAGLVAKFLYECGSNGHLSSPWFKI